MREPVHTAFIANNYVQFYLWQKKNVGTISKSSKESS